VVGGQHEVKGKKEKGKAKKKGGDATEERVVRLREHNGPAQKKISPKRGGGEIHHRFRERKKLNKAERGGGILGRGGKAVFIRRTKLGERMGGGGWFSGKEEKSWGLKGGVSGGGDLSFLGGGENESMSQGKKKKKHMKHPKNKREKKNPPIQENKGRFSGV